MVNIDDLNKYIEDFGETIKEVKKIGKTIGDISDITEKQLSLMSSFETFEAKQQAHNEELLQLISKKQDENKEVIQGYMAKLIMEQNNTLIEIVNSKEKTVLDLIEKNRKLTLFATIAASTSVLLSAVVLLQMF